MSGKDFREIQVSSSLLIFIFLGILGLGVVIFLLGVSVGKKQASISAQAQVVASPIQIPEIKDQVQLTTQQTLPAEKPQLETTSKPNESAKSQAETTSKPVTGQPSGSGAEQKKALSRQTTQPEHQTKTTSTAQGSGLYYVQVGAFTNKSQALTLAEKYKRLGYSVNVADPRPSDTKSWFRVRLGGFENRDKAVALLNKLNADAGGRTDFRVVRD